MLGVRVRVRVRARARARVRARVRGRGSLQGGEVVGDESVELQVRLGSGDG